MNVEHWWKNIGLKNGRTCRQTGPSDTVSYMGPTLSGLKLDPFCVVRGRELNTRAVVQANVLNRKV